MIDSTAISASPHRVTLVMTVLNDAPGTRDVLDSLAAQSRKPDEIIIVDGGSTDGTLEVITDAATQNQAVRLLRAPGANIARGRNLGIAAATGELIVLTDSGCRLHPDWLARITAPFDADPATEFVGGFYRIDPHTLLEAVVGLITLRGTLDPIAPDTFNASCRSMAFTRSLWRRAGGFPEWLYTAEDTLFDHKVRRLRARSHFAADAVVFWRPRTTWAATYRQFRGYATGMAQIGQGLRDVLYHARNFALTAAFAVGALFQPLLGIGAAAAFAYFYIYGFHRKSERVAALLADWRAYPLSIVMHWLLLVAGLDGQFRARLRRHTAQQADRRCLSEYLGESTPLLGR
jgi:succinoglycan biosynthesis protein ExoA